MPWLAQKLFIPPLAVAATSVATASKRRESSSLQKDSAITDAAKSSSSPNILTQKTACHWCLLKIQKASFPTRSKCDCQLRGSSRRPPHLLQSSQRQPHQLHEAHSHTCSNIRPESSQHCISMFMQQAGSQDFLSAAQHIFGQGSRSCLPNCHSHIIFCVLLVNLIPAFSCVSVSTAAWVSECQQVSYKASGSIMIVTSVCSSR